MKKLEAMEADNSFEKEVKTKKEILTLRRELEKTPQNSGRDQGHGYDSGNHVRDRS